MSIRSRWVTAVAAAVSGLVALALPSAAATTSDPVEAAAGWLGRQLVDGDHMEVTFGDTAFPDQGLTIDVVLALTSAGVGGASADAAVTWLGQPDVLGTYVGDGTDESYAGSLAKLALAAQVRGADPTDFGTDGVDLIGRLLDRQADSGRFSDQSAFGDFSGTFSQSFAVLALHRQGVDATVVDDGASYLSDQQCPDGGFPQTFEQATCTSQVDATALAVQALLAVGETTPATAAVDYLEAQQAGDGGFGNANSTGLAAAALAVAGSPAADDATAALLTLQQGCTAAPADRGAIAFDASGLDDRAARATSQAVPGLVGANLATLSVAGGEPAELPELACGTTTTTSTTTTTTAPGSSTTTSTPGSTGSTLPAAPPAGEAITTLSPTTVVAGGTVSMAEPGFQPGEVVQVVLWSDPVLLATVTADATGTVRATVTIPATTAPGTHTLALVGASTTKVQTITVTAAPAASGRLPATGTEAAATVELGVAAVAAGLALVLAARRRQRRLASPAR